MFRPRLSYIICTTPRSGSTFLGSILWQTGVAGKPTEYFNAPLRDEILCSRKLGITSERDYLPAMIQASTTKNAVFGTKLHAAQTDFFLFEVELHKNAAQYSLRTALESEFPNLKYILLTREDKIRQAVSYYRATMTASWYHFNETRLSPLDDKLEFDHFGIEKCRARLEISDQYWERYFSAHQLSPLRLTYEKLSDDYGGTARRVLDFLGLPQDIEVPPPTTVRIADKRSAEWAKRCESLGRLYVEEGARQMERYFAPF